MVRFQARSLSNAASSRPVGWRAAISSAVRFADSQARNSLRNCSTSAGYENSTFPGSGPRSWSVVWSAFYATDRDQATKPDSTLEHIFGQQRGSSVLVSGIREYDVSVVRHRVDAAPLAHLQHLIDDRRGHDESVRARHLLEMCLDVLRRRLA